MNYPVRSCGQRIPVNFKNSNGTVGRKRFVTRSQLRLVLRQEKVTVKLKYFI